MSEKDQQNEWNAKQHQQDCVMFAIIDKEGVELSTCHIPNSLLDQIRREAVIKCDNCEEKNATVCFGCLVRMNKTSELEAKKELLHEIQSKFAYFSKISTEGKIYPAKILRECVDYINDFELERAKTLGEK